LPLLETAWHCGYDLYHLTVPDHLHEPISSHNFMDGDHGPKSLQLMWDAPFYFQFPDGRFPVIGDSSAGPLNADDVIWTGWARYGDPKYLWLLQKDLEVVGDLPGLLFGPLPAERAAFEIGNTSFANVGINRQGCTLFPSAGFALLRQDERDPRSIAVAFSFGPFGGGHGHPDKLCLVLHGLGGEPITDFGSCSYASPLKGSWTHQTVAHNTVVVDARTQATQTTGQLDFFHADPLLRVARAHDDAVYPGIHLERTVALLGSVVIDLFTVAAAEEHTCDYVLHVDGELEGLDALPPRAEPLGEGNGYPHLEDVRSVVVEGDWRGVWVGATARLATTLLGDGATEVCAARSLTNSEDVKMPLLLARRPAARTTFVTVLDAHETQPRATAIERLGLTALALRIDGAPVHLVWDTTGLTIAEIVNHNKGRKGREEEGREAEIPSPSLPFRPLPSSSFPLAAVAQLAVRRETPDGVEVSVVGGTEVQVDGLTVRAGQPGDFYLRRRGDAWTVRVGDRLPGPLTATDAAGRAAKLEQESR
jgi:hypothetical protein